MVGIDASYSTSGKDIDSFTEEELLISVENVSVYYRTTPSHKLSIVKALQKNGHIVAMTGDGVNDALALRLAVLFYLCRILAWLLVLEQTLQKKLQT